MTDLDFCSYRAEFYILLAMPFSYLFLIIWKNNSNKNNSKAKQKIPKSALYIIKLIIVIYHPLCYTKCYGYSMKPKI